MNIDPKIQPINSSRRALEFATWFHEDEKKKQQKDASSFSGDFEPASDDLADNQYWKSKRVGTVNYKKWENLEKRLTREEMKEEEQLKAESEERSKICSGCAHDHSKERQIFEKSTLEKLNAGERFQVEGNSYYTEKQFGLAAVNYRKALLQLDYCFPEKEEDIARYNKIRLCCLLNLAACKLHHKDMEEVINMCTQALEIDASSCKGYYRMGLAYLEKDDYVNAEKYLLEALAIQPKCKNIHVALSKLKHKVSLYSRRTASVCRSMFQNAEEVFFSHNHQCKKTPKLTISNSISTEDVLPANSIPTCMEMATAESTNIFDREKQVPKNKACFENGEEAHTPVKTELSEHKTNLFNGKIEPTTGNLGVKMRCNDESHKYSTNDHPSCFLNEEASTMQNTDSGMNDEVISSNALNLQKQLAGHNLYKYSEHVDDSESCEDIMKNECLKTQAVTDATACFNSVEVRTPTPGSFDSEQNRKTTGSSVHADYLSSTNTKDYPAISISRVLKFVGAGLTILTVSLRLFYIAFRLEPPFALFSIFFEYFFKFLRVAHRILFSMRYFLVFFSIGLLIVVGLLMLCTHERMLQSNFQTRNAATTKAENQ